MIAFLFPGQGSQAVGMAKALVDRFAEARAVFDEADAVLGFSLSDLVFNGPAEQLMLTENTQPALLTASVATQRVLACKGCTPGLVAGHSLGEYSAHVATGTFTFADAVTLVRHRGQYMQEAVPLGSGSMAAILGLDIERVTQACAEAAEGDVVSPANFNGPGQIVIAGATAAVRRAMERAKTLGARRAIALSVSAPFHCALMKPAEERLAPELRAIPATNPQLPVIANVDAEPKTEAGAAIDALIRQVSAPVRWEQVIERMVTDGATQFVEVGPGTVLSGLGKKIAPSATFIAVSVPDDLAAVEAMFAR